jgi:hypothetical protein
LEAAQKALGELDGELGSVSMDPHDQASIEAAIQKAARLVDERVAPTPRIRWSPKFGMKILLDASHESYLLHW